MIGKTLGALAIVLGLGLAGAAYWHKSSGSGCCGCPLGGDSVVVVEESDSCPGTCQEETGSCCTLTAKETESCCPTSRVKVAASSCCEKAAAEGESAPKEKAAAEGDNAPKAEAAKVTPNE